MIKIGKRTVAFSTCLLVLDEEQAEVEFSVEGWQMKLFISFHPNANADNTVKWSLESGGLRARFDRWDNALGMALGGPANIGHSPTGKPIELLVFHHRIGNLNRLDLQITVGDEK